MNTENYVYLVNEVAGTNKLIFTAPLDSITLIFNLHPVASTRIGKELEENGSSKMHTNNKSHPFSHLGNSFVIVKKAIDK